MDFIEGIKSLGELLVDDKTRNVAVVVGVIFAFVSIRTTRTVARKKQSADMLFASKKDDKLALGYQTIRAWHDGEENMRLLATTKRNEPAAVEIRYLLNHFESVCVGIRASIYDQQMFKESWYSVMTETYKKSLPYIEAIRERDGKQTIFQSFEWLAKNWIAEPLKTYPTHPVAKFWSWLWR